ncbi:MAG: Ig domain-containing protein [Oscillospiraceae bacterium]|nr:Ig domain-containing protein [Oscillospiraceae bacterium]
MQKTGKKLLSVLLALAMVLSLLPGVALRAAADDVTYVQITSTPTAETLANMITYDQDAALAIYNSAEFQAGAGPNGGIVLIYNVGEADGEYMIIHNAQGSPEVMSMALDTIGMLLQYGFNVYIVQPGGSEPPPTPSNPTVYYRYYTLNTDDWTITPTVDSTNEYSLITDSSTTWEEGWYVVDGNVVITGGVYLTGTVRLILCDGASLTVNGGIMSQISGCKLIVYPGVMERILESVTRTLPTIEGTGALNALSTEEYMPGIGYTTEVEIHGGTVYAVGAEDAAGIGGAPYADGSLLIMYDGTLTAIGGTNGAGIGGSTHYSGGNVSIYGGTVTAIGGENAAGIGAGANGSSDGTLNYNSEGILLETSDDNLNWSVYSDAAPRGRYMRAQVINEQPAAIPSADEGFFDDFEGEFTWTIQNGGQTNAWYLGEAVNNGGSKALYVSNDGGASNTYTVYKSSFVFVEKTFSFEGGYYNFAYDWRGDGETAYDFIRMALIPVDFEVTAGSTYPLDFSADGLPEGWIAIDGGSKLNLQSEWQHDIYEDVLVPAGVYRAAIIWQNDTSAGTQPAGAIDNFSIAPGNYTPVEGPVSADEGYTDDFEGINTWTLHNGEQINAWYVGDAVNNGGGKALYVSKDGGFTNAYDIYNYSFAFADKLFRFDGGAYDFAYDWRCGGEENWDYLRVALIPEDAEPVPGEEPNGFAYRLLPSGWISLDNDGQLVNQTNWQHLSIEGLEVPAGDYYVAFLWRNDDSVGNEIPAAIDNFSVAPHGSAYVPVTGITLSNEALELEVGVTAILTATVEPDNATEPAVTWISSDETVATVNENGVVTAIAEGEAVITATADGVSAVCTVTVTAPPITDGFYLIGPNGWTVDDLREEDRFDLNPNAEGEYMLSTALNVGDPVKVVKVENGAVSAWYPDGVGNEYIVDGPHSGTVSVYFRETWNDAWAEIGGFFWIEAQLTEPYLDESLNFFTSISVDIELSTRYSIPVEMVENYASWYLEVSKLNADGEPIETRIFGDGGESVEMVRSAAWQAVYTDISVKELGTSFAATLHVFAPNGQESYSPTQIDNLRNVVLDVLVTDEMPDQYQTVAADLLNFAAAAQIYFNYDVEHLANEDLSENAVAALEQFASSGEAPAEQINSPEGPTIFSSVSIMNRIVLSLAVRGAGSANAVQLQIRNHETGEVKDIIDAAKRGSIWMGSYRGFGAEDMRTAFDIVAIADGEEFGTPITWSVKGYAREARLNEDSTEEELNLFNALLHFVDSCVAVFAN